MIGNTQTIKDDTPRMAPPVDATRGGPGRGIKPVFSYKIQNFKKKICHLHGDLNLDEIKNTLRLLSVNGETNLMNLIRL